MEINEKIPVGIYFTVDFDAKHVWEHDHFYGCSIDAASEMVKSFGYILWKVQYNNAVFIRGDFAPTYFKDQAPEEAYVQGYKNQLDRRNKFPWNSDVDYWLELPTKDAIDQLKKYFKKYEGKFTIRGSTPQDSRQTPSTYNQTSPENEYFKGD